MRPISEGTRSPHERRLEELADAIEVMLGYTSQRDLSGVFETAVRTLHANLNAEDVCVLYLNPRAKSSRLVRLVSYGDKDQLQTRPAVEGTGGLCEWLFLTDRLNNMAGEPLRKTLATLPGRHPSYLSSNETFSVLAVPLRDRKGRATYLLKASNKKDASGRAGPDLGFTEEDVQTARVVGLTLATHFEYADTFRVVRRGVKLLTAAADRNQSMVEIGNTLAAAAQQLTKADVAKFYPSDDINEAKVVNQSGEATAHEEMLRRTLADAGGLQREGGGEKHQLAVAVGPNDDRWGVLYLEAGHRPGFDARDEVAVQLLTEQAKGALRLQRAVTERPDWTTVNPAARRKAAEQILETAWAVWRFAKGVVYLADEGDRKLRCAAATGWEEGGLPDGFPEYDVTDSGVVADVYHGGKVVGPLPPPQGHGVGWKGLPLIDAGTPFVAMRLVHDDRPLGVLLVWGGEVNGRNDPDARRQVRAFSELAATHLANSCGGTGVAFDGRGEAPPEELTDAVWAEQLRDILVTVKKAGGFDRVRLFAYDGPHQRFLPTDCLGMNRQRFLTRARIRIADNLYAQDLVDTFAKGPRCYGQGTERDFGTDPHRKVLEKPDGLPWAVAPIFQGGRLLGQVVADNERTRRRIAAGALDALQAEAMRAAEWLKGRAWVAPISLVGLRLLHQWVAKSNTRYDVTKRLLAYLTCGDALGFSRGVFLAPDGSGKKLVYRSGTGSIARANFERIGHRTRTMDLSDVLRAAPETDDDIGDALADLVIEIDAEEENLQLTTQLHEIEVEGPSEQRSPWQAKLAEALGPGRVATVPVRRDEKLLGLFIVDRRWQDRAVSKQDVAVLQRFAVETATILTERERERTTTTNQKWEQALAHHCRGGLGKIAGHVENILLQAGRPPGQVAAPDHVQKTARNADDIFDDVLKVKRLADDLTRVVNHIYEVKSLAGKLKVASVREALTCEMVRRHFEEQGVRYTPWLERDRGGPPLQDVQVAIHQDILTGVVYELAKNACRALNRWENPDDPFDYFSQPDPKVQVEVIRLTSEPLPRILDRDTRYALLLFTDNGKGVEWALQRKVFIAGEFAQSSREQGGTGLGLFLVREEIEAYRGHIGFFSEPGGGATFYLYLPLAGENTLHRPAGSEEVHP